MKTSRTHLFGLLAFFSLLSTGCIGPSHANQEALLWPKGTPNARGDTVGDHPRLFYYLPDAKNKKHVAIVVAAGGSYGHQLGIATEGFETAQYLAAHGYVAVVVRYRVGQDGYNHEAFLADAKRAVRTVRSQAEQLDFDPGEIGMIGFSAGGHLAASVGIRCDGDQGEKGAKDPIDRTSCAVAFAAPIYPVITMDDEYVHKRSRNNLVRGIDHPSPELFHYLSLETQVRPTTPPMFIVTTKRDKKVRWQNSQLLYDALKKQGVDSEFLLFEDGKHGVGLANHPDKMPLMSTWPESFLRFVETHTGATSPRVDHLAPTSEKAAPGRNSDAAPVEPQPVPVEPPAPAAETAPSTDNGEPSDAN